MSYVMPRGHKHVRISLRHNTNRLLEDRKRVRDFFVSRPWMQRAVLTLDESVWLKLGAWAEMRPERIGYLTGFVDAWMASER